MQDISIFPRRVPGTGHKGEITVGPDCRSAYVHDGSTPGGTPLGNFPGHAAPPALLSWAYAQAFAATSAVRDDNGALVMAVLLWPDGIDGLLTTDAASTEFPGAVDAWHATYNGVTPQLVTQALVAQPPITVTAAPVAQPPLTFTAVPA
jgi:hypothetical protein